MGETGESEAVHIPSSLCGGLRAPEPGGRKAAQGDEVYLCGGGQGGDKRAQKGDVSRFINLQRLSSYTLLSSEHHPGHIGLGYRKEIVLEVRQNDRTWSR